MALIPVDDDTWLREAESCERLCIEINAQIAERNREAVTSERYQQLSAAIRVRLNQLNSQTKEVRLKLGVTKENLTDEERERRLRQVEVLESKRIRLQTEFQDLASVRQNDRDQLLVGGNGATTATSSRGGGGVLGGQTVDLLQVQHKQIIQEQDEGLENLAKIISRQKDIAIRIHEEVQNQNGKVNNANMQKKSFCVWMKIFTLAFF